MALNIKMQSGDMQSGLRQLVSLDNRLRDQDRPPRPGIPAPASNLPDQASATFSILIAEDNAINQKVIERMVQKLGYRVNLVANGREAIEAITALGHAPYSLIFMDCQMPEMDGFEACRQIRKLNTGVRIPIIAITANAMKGDRERCLAAGMDDYVSKPFKQEDLRIVMERWLNRAASAEQESKRR